MNIESEDIAILIAEDIKKGKVSILYTDIKHRYKVGSGVVKRARELAGKGVSKARQVAAEKRNKKLRNESRNKKLTYIDEVMYRPNGVNMLTVPWR
jgi:GDP-D-mannose dehydratase